jgi:predicted metal-dependent phosphoesterase TrpH
MAWILKQHPDVLLKVELHTHTSDDPIDRIPHTVTDLIDRAAALGYQALAITLHDRQLDIRPFVAYGCERGIVLIPGIERTIQGRHVLLLNFQSGAAAVRTFEDLARLKRREPGLVVAPHPFFPASTCLGRDLDRYPMLFDAVECNAMYTKSVNFNRRAEHWAVRHDRPLVGNCDVHRLWQLGTTYSLVEAELNADDICASIAAGRVRVESQPLTWVEVARTLATMFLSDFASQPEPAWRAQSFPDPSALGSTVVPKG